MFATGWNTDIFSDLVIRCSECDIHVNYIFQSFLPTTIEDERLILKVAKFMSFSNLITLYMRVSFSGGDCLNSCLSVEIKQFSCR